MRHTWDEKKNRSNRKLHGITFQDAIRIFEAQPWNSEMNRYNYGEDRIYAIGQVNGLEIHTDLRIKIYVDEEDEDENNERLIISAWRSEPHERRRYWQSIEAQ